MSALRVGLGRGIGGISRAPWRRSMSGISGGSMGGSWKDREHAAEEMYFSKADAAALSKLTEKLHAHHTPSVDVVSQEKAAVTAILAKHSVAISDGLIDDIIKFKYPDH